MCAVLFKGDCGWEEEKDPDLCYAMLFVQIENSCFFPDIFVCLPELMLILIFIFLLCKYINNILNMQ